MMIAIKQSGETMDQFIKRIILEHNVIKIKKLAYTARLDPMAKGKVPILINDECKFIKNKLNTNKTYEFKIMLGINTDTDDILGLITNQMNEIDIEMTNKIKKDILDYLKKITDTTFEQNYHHYSTKMLNHKKKGHHDYTTNHKITFINYEFIKQDEYEYEKWKNKIIAKIENIDKKKNFRQKEIIKQWNDLLLEKISYIKMKINVSSGFFVRQLIHDISTAINFPLTCYNINRIDIE